MTHRLNMDERNMILNKIIEKSFKEKKAAIEKEALEMAYKLYEILYNPKKLDEMEALPKGWLPTAKSIDIVTTDHGWATFYFKKSKASECEKKLFLSMHNCNITVTPNQNPRLYKVVVDFIQRREALREEERQARIEVMAVLKSCSTAKKLIDTWPEIEEYVINVCVIKKGGLPAPVVGELNKKLNLPHKKAA